MGQGLSLKLNLYAAILVGTFGTAGAAQDADSSPLDNLLRELFNEAVPLMDQFGKEIEGDLREGLDAILPFALRLRDMVDDFGAYNMPEVLPNGDIIIRRKPTQQDPADSEKDQNPAIEL